MEVGAWVQVSPLKHKLENRLKIKFRIYMYSSTCHERPPPVRSESGPSWQVAPRGRERKFKTSSQKHK